jgi:AcrR family transcriptional regulator
MGRRAEKVQQMRAKLLEAAVAVLQRQGVNGFTLDAVAVEAGVSKGGLLHHFATKEALIAQMLRTMMAQFAASVEECQRRELPQPGSLLRAYVRASFNETTPLFPALGALLAVSVLENPELLALVQSDARDWRDRLAADAASSGLSAALAHLIRQAADAAWFDQLIGAAPEAEERAALRDELLALCTGEGT